MTKDSKVCGVRCRQWADASILCKCCGCELWSHWSSPWFRVLRTELLEILTSWHFEKLTLISVWSECLKLGCEGCKSHWVSVCAVVSLDQRRRCFMGYGTVKCLEIW